MEDFTFIEPEDVNFESNDNLEFVVLHPSILDDLDHNDPGYLNEILKRVQIDNETCTTENFFSRIGEILDNDNLGDDDTQIKKVIIHDEPNYMYEIMFLDIDNKDKIKAEIFNGLGTLLNTEYKHLFGKVILLKSYIPISDDSSMNLCKCDKKDIYNILDSRVNTSIVVFEDGEFREEKVKGEVDFFKKKFFGDDFCNHDESLFLLHNLNILYTFDDYGSEIIPNLVKGKIDTAVFYTMNNEDFRGNLTLDELKKIVFLSNKLDSFKAKEEWVNVEKDELNRNKVKNKYRVLEKVYNLNK